MRNLLFEASPIDPSTGLTVTVRMSSLGGDASGVELDGYRWIPCVVEHPVQSVSVFSSGRVQPINIAHGELKFVTDPALSNTAWSSLVWDGALGRVWVGDAGTPFASYTKIFEGALGAHSREGVFVTVPLFGGEVALQAVPLLSASYGGTGGAEGNASLKGRLKPIAYGACSNIAPVLVDPAYWIYQYHDGATQDVSAVYEMALSLGAPVATQPTTFAALQALSLQPGQWAKAPAIGMFRLGGQPTGKVTADVQGAKLAGTYVSTLATILPAILQAGGVAPALIDQSSFNAFGQAWSLYLTEQALVSDIVSEAMAQVQGYAFANSSGVWKAGTWFSTKTATTVREDRSTFPLVIPSTLAFGQAAPPFWRIRVGYDRCWSVHSGGEVSSALSDVQDDIDALDAAAQAAQDAADQAQANATLALNRLENISSDNVLDRSEKAQIVREFQQITAEKAGINSTASTLSITTENTAYNNAYTTLQTYLNGLSPAYTDTSAETTIVRTTWNTNWNAFYSARQALQDKIAQIAATKAGWGSVTGIPEAIADGRVGKGLTVDGDIQRVLPGSKLPNSAGNLIVDPLIADAAAWTLISNATIDSTATELSTFGLVRAFKHLPANGNMQLSSKMVPAQPGATYNHTVRLIAKAGANATFQHTVRFYDRSGNFLSQAFKNYPCGSPATDIAIDCSVTGVAPAGAAFVGAANYMGAWSTGTIWTANYAIRPVSTPALVNIGDTSNMIPDADFIDAPATWGISKFTVAPNNVAGKGAGANKLVIVSALGSEGAATANISISPNETIRCSIYIETVSGTTGNLLIAPYFYNAAGGAIAYGNFVLYAAGETGFYSSISKAPANTAFVRYQIFSYGGGNRVWHLSEPMMYRATVSGRNVVREDGTTPINDASIVTALGTAGYLAGAGTGAYANNLAQLNASDGARLDSAYAGVIAALDDDVLTASEKSTIFVPMTVDLQNQYTALTARASALGLSTTAINTARTNWLAVLSAISPSYGETSSDSTLRAALGLPAFPGSWSNVAVSVSTSGSYTVLTDAGSNYSYISGQVAHTFGGVAKTFSAGVYVKKDAIAGATRIALLRLFVDGGTSKYVDAWFDTSTGTVSGNPVVGSIDCGDAWFIWTTIVSNTNNTSVGVQLYPAVGANGVYNPATTGSASFREPFVVEGSFEKLGRVVITARLNEYRAAIESLRSAISAEDANRAVWSNVGSRPANIAALTGSEALNNAAITINANGLLTGAGGGQVTIGGLGYVGALNATANIVTRSSTAPSSPNNGDIWVDTSVTPNVTKVRVSGAWQVSANYVVNTNELTDGAGLGSTAVWANVTGSGRPENGATVGARAGVNLLDSSGATLTDSAIRNTAITINANGTISGAGGGQVTIGGLGYTGALNATANIVTRSSTAPASPANGDIWVDTSAAPHVTKVRVAGAWQIASNYVTDTAQIADGAGLGDTAVWNYVLDRPTSVATLNASDGAHLAGIETNADVTSQVTGTSEITINCSHTGAPLDGQLPKNSQFRLMRAGTDVSTSATWSRSIVSGSVTCTIGTSTGTLNITAITSDAVIRVAAALGGVTRVFDVRVLRSLAAPPATGGSGGGTGGSAASDTTFSTISSTSMAAITDELSVTVGSSGQVELAASSSVNSDYIGNFTVYSVWQRWNGSAWVDLSSEVMGNPGYNPNPPAGGSLPPVFDADPPYEGYFSNSLTVTGLTASSTQKFRLRARGDVSNAMYFHTSVASVQG